MVLEINLPHGTDYLPFLIHVLNTCINTGDDVSIFPVLFHGDLLIVHDQQYISNYSHISAIFCTSFDLFTETFPFRHVCFSETFTHSKKPVQPGKYFLLNCF